MVIAQSARSKGINFPPHLAFSPQYGFELEKTVAKLPIKELAIDADRIKLLESLERGNRQVVTFNTDQGDQKRFIEANPQFKSITVYDENQRRIRQSEDQGKSQEKSEAIKNEPGNKQEQKPGEEVEGQRNGKRKGVKV
jgi:hypothetical protein